MFQILKVTKIGKNFIKNSLSTNEIKIHFVKSRRLRSMVILCRFHNRPHNLHNKLHRIQKQLHNPCKLHPNPKRINLQLSRIPTQLCLLHLLPKVRPMQSWLLPKPILLRRILLKKLHQLHLHPRSKLPLLQLHPMPVLQTRQKPNRRRMLGLCGLVSRVNKLHSPRGCQLPKRSVFEKRRGWQRKRPV